MENTRKFKSRFRNDRLGCLLYPVGAHRDVQIPAGRHGRSRYRRHPGRSQSGPVMDRAAHKRLYNHVRHPGPAAGRIGTGTPIPAPLLRTAGLRNPAAGAGFDRAGAGTEEVRIYEHKQGWFSNRTKDRKPSLPELRSEHEPKPTLFLYRTANTKRRRHRHGKEHFKEMDE